MKWRKLNRILHRDLGYFFFGMTIIYALSGIALNHIDDWNPSYVITRKNISLQEIPSSKAAINREYAINVVDHYDEKDAFKNYYFPEPDMLKIFIEDGSIEVNIHSGEGKIEKSMKDSAAIIMGAPSYFGAPPGIIKDLIDRSRPMKMNKYQLKDKLFSVLGTSGLKGGGANYVQDVLIHFGLIQGMIVVGSLGHPVLNANLPSETLQKEALTDFRKPSEPGKLARKNTKSLAERIYSFLKEEG